MDSVSGRVKIERSIGPAGGWSRQLGVDRESGERVLVSHRTADATLDGDDEALRGRLRAVLSLRHSGLCPVVDVELDEDGAYAVEQVGRGVPLDDERCALPGGERLEEGLMRILEALAYLHRHGVAHGAVSRRTVVSDGRTLRLTGLGLKQAAGAVAAGDDVLCWAGLARDLLQSQKRTPVNSPVLAAAREVERVSREGRTPTGADVARELRRALLERSEEAGSDVERTEDRSGAMKAFDRVVHFTTSVLLGLMTTIVTAAAIVGLVALGVLWFMDRLPEEVGVPNVIGLSENEARERLTGQGLKVGDIRRVYREDAERGKVVSALPEVGMTVREGREITLVVSRGAAQVRVPRLIGLRPEEARKVLEETGLAPVEGGRVRSEATEDEVVRQTPSPGQRIAQGDRVEFFVSGGPEHGMIVAERDDGETARVLFRKVEIVVPAGDSLQRVEVKEGYDSLETTYDRLHRPGDKITLNTHGMPGKKIRVIIEGEQVFETQLQA